MQLFAEMQKKQRESPSLNLSWTLEPGTYLWELAEELVTEGRVDWLFDGSYSIRATGF